MGVLDQLQSVLNQSLERTGLPGAAVAVSADGVLYEAASGVVNTRTAVPCTPDSLFMFGSVTKTVTSTMVLRLIQQGALSLDRLARECIPEFKIADQRYADGVDVRQLLTHTSGLVGSVFTDTGRNPDALSKQIDLIVAAPPYHAPGRYLSYCNSGYMMLGRAIEVATGKTWDGAVQAMAAEALGVDSIVTRPEQALRFSAAVGHVIDPKSGQWVPIPEPFAIPGHGPAGSTMAGRARDLARLAARYLDANVLSASTVEQAWSMQAPALAPGGLQGWGLGWMIFDWNGRKVVGHDGSTAGTKSFLRVVPDKNLAVAVLINSQAGLPVYEDVVGAIFRELVGVWEHTVEDMPKAPVSAVADCVGTFADSHLRIEVSIDGDGVKGAIMPNATNPIHRPVLMSYPGIPCGPNAFYSTGQAVIFYPPAKHLDTRLVRVSKLVRTEHGETFLCSGASIYRALELGS